MVNRGLISFDIEKNKMWYHLLLPNGAAYEDALAVLDEIKNALIEQQKAAAEQQAEQKSDQAVELQAA